VIASLSFFYTDCCRGTGRIRHVEDLEVTGSVTPDAFHFAVDASFAGEDGIIASTPSAVMASPALRAFIGFLGPLIQAKLTYGAWLLRRGPFRAIATFGTIIPSNRIDRFGSQSSQIADKSGIALPCADLTISICGSARCDGGAQTLEFFRLFCHVEIGCFIACARAPVA
jgi:hypothetical protein